MSKSCKINEDILIEMYGLLENEKYSQSLASISDLTFITNGAWLKDAAVIDIINKKHGVWNVYMVFANYKNPMQFIIRNITKCFSEQKAKSTAFYIRKEAAKDRRGTLSISISDLNLCDN